MGNDWTDPSGSEANATELVAALKAEQDELWGKLRQEDDPDQRMALLSRFGELRLAMRELNDGGGGDSSPDGGGADVEQPLSAMVGTAFPFGSYDTDLSTDIDEMEINLDEDVGNDVADTRRTFEIRLPPLETYSGFGGEAPGAGLSGGGGLPNGFGPASHRSGIDGAGPAETRSAADPYDYGNHHSVGTRHADPDQAVVGGEAFAGAAAGGPGGGGRSIEPAWRATAVLAVLAVVLFGVWLLLPGADDRAAESAAATVATAGDTDLAAPVADDPVAGIRQLLVVMGADGVTVEDREGAIHLIGVVPTTTEREALVGAAQALAGDRVVDVSELLAADGATGEVELSRAQALQAELDRVVASTPIIFEVGQVDLTELHKRVLNTISTAMLAYPGVVVNVVGYTDGAGDDVANRDLSQARAEAVRAYLESQGVAPESLGIDAKGEVTSTGSEALAGLERRVEFEVAAVDAAPPVGGEQLRIAIVAPSARNDLAFTQSMVDAVNVIASERGNVAVSVTDNTFVPDEAAAAIRSYAAEGYDLVIAHGSQFGAPLKDIAIEYPDVAFAWGTASDTFGLPNVYAYDAASEQGGFVLGALAARLSGTGTMGVVGPIEVGDAQRYINGFSAGAKAEAPTSTVLVTYTGSFSDLSLASETAQAHLAAGADVLTGSAQMVVGAISVASENGVPWFGNQANQSSLAPGNVAASQVYHWEVILREVVADLDAGNPGGRTYTADLANGGLVIEYNDANPLPDPVRQRGDELVAAIATGQVVAPAG